LPQELSLFSKQIFPVLLTRVAGQQLILSAGPAS